MARRKPAPKRKRRPAKKPAAKPATRRGPDVWRPAFLARLRASGNVTVAAEAATVDRATVYDARAADAGFAEAWKAALEEAADRLEAEARRRAHDGLLRKKFTAKGEPVIDPETGEQYWEREYSDVLLMFLLKAARPEKFRDRLDLRHAGQLQVRHDDALASAILADPAAAELACRLLERVGPGLRDAGGPGTPGQ